MSRLFPLLRGLFNRSCCCDSSNYVSTLQMRSSSKNSLTTSLKVFNKNTSRFTAVLLSCWVFVYAALNVCSGSIRVGRNLMVFNRLHWQRSDPELDRSAYGYHYCLKRRRVHFTTIFKIWKYLRALFLIFQSVCAQWETTKPLFRNSPLCICSIQTFRRSSILTPSSHFCCNPPFLFPQPKLNARKCFTIRHYAGSVTYTADGFLDKNRVLLMFAICRL